MFEEKQLIRSFQPTVSKVAVAVAMSFFGRIFSVFFAIGLGNLGSNTLSGKIAVWAGSALVYSTSLGVIAGEAMRNRALGEVLNVLWCYLVICTALTLAGGSMGAFSRVRGISKKQARERVLAKGKADGHDWALIDEQTREEDFGWVFFCTSKADAARSYPPIIVDRLDGTVHTTGLLEDLETYLQRYRRERNSSTRGSPPRA